MTHIAELVKGRNPDWDRDLVCASAKNHILNTNFPFELICARGADGGGSCGMIVGLERDVEHCRCLITMSGPACLGIAWTGLDDGPGLVSLSGGMSLRAASRVDPVSGDFEGQAFRSPQPPAWGLRVRGVDVRRAGQARPGRFPHIRRVMIHRGSSSFDLGLTSCGTTTIWR